MHRLPPYPRVLLLILLGTSLLGPDCRPAPTIAIDSPAHGSFTTDSTVVVHGRVTGRQPHEVQVLVNGAPAPVQPDGTFSHSVTLDQVLNPVLAELAYLGNVPVRDRITVIAGESIAEGAPATTSPAQLALRLSDAGLDRLGVQLAESLDLDLQTLLPTGTYLTTSDGYLVYVDGPEWGSPAHTLLGIGLEFDADSGEIEARIDLYDARVYIWLDGPDLLFSANNCEGYLETARLGIAGRFGLSPDPLDPSLVAVTQVGGLAIDSPGIYSDFYSGICDTFGAGGNETADVVEAMRLLLAEEDESGRNFVEVELSNALNDLALSSAVGEALGFSLDAEMSDVAEDADGLTVEARTSVTGACPGGPPELDASLHVDEALPAYGTTTPGGQPYDVAIGLSASSINQLLMTQVECGLLATDITELDLGIPGVDPLPLTAEVLAGFIPAFTQYTPPDAPFRVELRPTLAPVLTGEAGPGGELAEMQLAQLELRAVEALGGEPVLVATVDVAFGIDASLDAAGLSFQVAAPSASDVVVTVVGDRLGVDVAGFEGLMPHLLAPLLPSLASALGTIELPSFLDMTLAGVEASRQGDTLSLFVDLEPAPLPPLYWRRDGNRLDAYRTPELLAGRGFDMPDVRHAANGQASDGIMYALGHYWRRWGSELRAFTTPEGLANGAAPLLSQAAVGDPRDGMMADATYWWRRIGAELRGYSSYVDLALNTNPVIIHPAEGSPFDAMTYDGTYYWRRYGGDMRGYLTPSALAAVVDPVVRYSAYGSSFDGLMYDGTRYWRRLGGELQAYPTAENVATIVNRYASLPAVGSPTDSMMYDGTHYWRVNEGYLRAYRTPRELALGQHPVATFYLHGDTLDAMFHAFGYYWRRYGTGSLRYFYSVGGSIGLAVGNTPEADYPAAGANSDGLMYDGTYFWRRVGATLRGYSSPNDAALQTNHVVSHPAQGQAADAMMYTY